MNDKKNLITKLDPKNFEEIKLYLVLLNETSGTANILNEELEFIQIGKTSLSVVMPIKRCAVGHKFLVWFFTKEKDYLKYRDIKMNQTAAEGVAVMVRVKALEPFEENKEQAICDVIERANSSWERLVNRIQKRQIDVNVVIRKMNN